MVGVVCPHSNRGGDREGSGNLSYDLGNPSYIPVEHMPSLHSSVHMYMYMYIHMYIPSLVALDVHCKINVQVTIHTCTCIYYSTQKVQCTYTVCTGIHVAC